VLDMGEAGPVTAFALHVVIARIGHRRVPRGVADRVPELGDRVALIAGRNGMSRSLQIDPRARVPRRFPLTLHADVAVATGRLLGRDREVAEESIEAVGGRVEGGSIAEDDLR